MSTLRQAAQAALDALDRTETSYGSQQWERESEAQDALRAALAQPAPAQPVDKGPWSVSRDGRHICSDDFELDVMLKVDGDFADDAQRTAYSDALAARLNSTHPAQPAAPVRQPLTDEQVFTSNEIMAVNASARLMMHTLLLLVRAVEAAHGIGEQGGAQ